MVSFPDAASLIVLILDLVEGIITTIHFDEDVHGMFFLALFWVGYGFADNFFQELTTNTKCRWDDCLFKCGTEVGQCVLYIHFCKKDAGVDVPLQVLAAIQLFLVCSGTIVWECRNRPNPGRDKSFVGGDVENADQAGTIVGVVGEHNELASESQANVKDLGEGHAERDTGRVSRKSATAERAQVMREMDMEGRSRFSPWVQMCGDGFNSLLCTLLPLLYQEESPYRQKWYELLICVYLWNTIFQRHVLVSFKNANVRMSSVVFSFFVTMCYSIMSVVLTFSWGLSAELHATYDRVFTVLGMISFGIAICCGLLACCCSCCAACAARGQDTE